MGLSRAWARWLLTLTLAGVLVFASESEAEACVCVNWRTFDEVSREAPVVVVGRVVALGPVTKGWLSDPTFIEIAVERVSKGRLAAERVKVWNATAGTSCGGAFTRTPTGTALRIALTPVVRKSAEEEEELDRFYWSIVGFKPPVGDYLVTTACANGFELVDKPR
jgi:hypothetical protein